jgi:hypothetical protein
MSVPPDDGDARAALDLLLRGFQVSRMLRLVADLGIADRIPPDGDRSLDALAVECSVQPQALIRILRALASFAVFTVAPDGSIAHTPRSRLLRTDATNSLHHAARFWAGAGSWSAWGQLDAALNDEVPHEAAWNMSRFDYLRAYPDEARLYDAMMAHFPDDRHAAIAAAYDFSGARVIADIGGGDGATLRHILTRWPAPSGLIFDREDVVRSIPQDKLLEGRIALASGSFFESVPGGADIYMVTRVLHNWSDEDCLRILRVCRAAMGQDALLLLGEQVLEPDPANGRAADYLVDVQMMAMFGSARTRTAEEFASLLADSDFVMRRIVPTKSPVSIVEAAPA